MKTIMITGSSSGIGLATARQLLSDGNKIIMLCRSGDKAQEAKDSLLETTGCGEESIDLVFADLGSRIQIQSAIEDITNRYKSIDVLINNAGVFRTKRNITEDGLEMNFAVNYLALVQISSGMIPLLKKAPEARVINVNSEIYKQAAIPVIYLATSPEVGSVSGGYFIKTNQSEPMFPNENWSLQSDIIWKVTRKILEGFTCLPE